MENNERKRFVIQYLMPGQSIPLIAIVAAINKIEAKTLFLKEYPGAQIQIMMEEKKEQ